MNHKIDIRRINYKPDQGILHNTEEPWYCFVIEGSTHLLHAVIATHRLGIAISLV